MITPNQYALFACVVAFTACAAVLDWRSKRLPNWLTVSIAVAGLVFHVIVGFLVSGLAGMGQGLLLSLGGFAVGFGLLFVLWAIGASGGGDVKYTAALGTWLGAAPTFYVIVVSVCLVALTSVFMLVFEVMRRGLYGAKAKYIEQPKTTNKRALSDEAKQEQMVRRRLMPWAVPTALATWLVLAFQFYQASNG